MPNDRPPAQPTDRDRLAARRLVDQWLAVRARGTHLGTFGQTELVGRIADATAAARADGYRAALDDANALAVAMREARR